MNMPITAWIDLTLHQAQRCHHFAWFLYGCFEREHVLNVDAFGASWIREIAWPSNRLLFSNRASNRGRGRDRKQGPVQVRPG